MFLTYRLCYGVRAHYAKCEVQTDLQTETIEYKNSYSVEKSYVNGDKLDINIIASENKKNR